MLVSTPEKFEHCEWSGKVFSKINAFLRTATPDMATGRYELQGDEIVALVSNYNTNPLAGALPETHVKYVDVQVLLAGKEFFCWCPAEGLKEAKPYDPEADIAFFEQPAIMSRILLVPGMFALVFPDDAHMPQIAVEDSEPVVKIVFKVKTSLLC